MKNRLTALYWLFLFPLSISLVQGQAILDTRIDVQHYAFYLTLSDLTDEIQGKTDVLISFQSPGVRTFTLNLQSKANPFDQQGMTVASVLQDNIPVSFQHHQDQLTISLPEPARRGARHTFTITYRGVPQDGLIISQNKYGDRTFFGDNWPNRARHWLPTHDHPSDKATCEFIVQAPEHYEVIANGIRLEESDLPVGPENKPMKRTHWATQHPVPTKVMVIGAARFAIRYDRTSHIPIEHWVYPEDRKVGFENLSPTADIIKFFEQKIGSYPYEKLANVQSKTQYGGMENASNIFYNEDALSQEKSIESLIAHEVAHQWFGDAVTEKSWKDVWLSEGFSTYLAHWYTENTYGRDSMEANLRRDRDRIFTFHLKSPNSAVVDTTETNLFKLLNANTYQKGAWVLHMLRFKVGEKAFQKIIRQYYQRYRHGNASTEDFQRIATAVSGQNLDQFFSQWLYQPGYPVVEGSWKLSKRKKKLSITLKQVQELPLYEMDMQVGIYYQNVSQPEVRTIHLSQQENTYEFDLPQSPVNVVLDPNTWVLMEQFFNEK